MNKYNILFHFHSCHSFDATNSLRNIIKALKNFKITHLVLTEHNNLDSYNLICDLIKKENIPVEIIPACEYTTEVGDLIILFCDKLLKFDNYKELIDKAKNEKALIALPHPYKRDSYPKDLIEKIDLYELLNLRGANRYFDNSIFKNKNFFFGSDSHNFLDFPGCINHYYSRNTNIRTVLLNEIPVPSIHRKELMLINFISKIISKLKKLL